MKDLIKAAAGFFTILLAGFLFLLFSDSSDNIKVDGRDAIGIAMQHSGYVWACIIGLLLVIASVIAGIRFDLSGTKAALAGVLTGLVFALLVLTKPVNIKTDPKSAGITTEEINYLKSKGLQDSNK